ncbi:MAG: hypothetical protein ACR2GA_07105 [Chloroflexota bacterium]
MLADRWGALNRSRVNPLAPGLVVVIGLAAVGLGYQSIGIGVAVGAVLAWINGLLLSRRVDMAAVMGNVGTAMMAMQLGLLLTMTIIGVTTVILVHFSVALAVSAAAGFAAAQLAILATFYWTHGRGDGAMES